MHLVLDFDGTLTVRDTIGALARAAIAFQSERAGGASRERWTARWQALVDAYAADCAAHTAKHAQPAAHYYRDREAASASASASAASRAYFASARAVEQRSVQRVAASGLFAGMGSGGWLEGAGRGAVDGDGDDSVVLRRGVSTLLADAAARGWRVSILSVNWSDAWVRGVLSTVTDGSTLATDTATTATDTASLAIVSNTVTEDGRIVRNRHCPPGDDALLTGDDKRAALRHMTGTSEEEEEEEKEEEGAGAVVYVGDSLTDVECLVAAASTQREGGGGIVLGDEESAVVQTLRGMGYRVARAAAAEGAGAGAGDEGVVWARDVEEVVGWVQGRQRTKAKVNRVFEGGEGLEGEGL